MKPDPSGVINEATKTIVEYGFGAAALLLGIACFFLVRALVRAKDKHIADKDVAAKAAQAQAVESAKVATQVAQIVEEFGDENSRAHETIERKLDALALADPNVDQTEYLRALQRRG